MRLQNSLPFFIAGLALCAPAASAAPAADSPLQALGMPVSAAQLQGARARGEIVVSAASSGNVGNNSVDGQSVTGVITDNQSIQNNTGFTTVLQNTGNNALLQNSTSIYISAK